MRSHQRANAPSAENASPGKLTFLRAAGWRVGLVIENVRAILPFAIGSLFRVREPRFNVPAPGTIQTTISVISQAEAGPILEISFAGRYPPGSLGNEHAAHMREAARTAIEEKQPAGVLFNLSSLNYVWGDSICGLAYTLIDPVTKTFVASSMFATGRTATALEGLFFPGCVVTIVGMRLFRDRDRAVEYLTDRLKGKAV